MVQSILVCLHGWGGSKESFTELRAALKGLPIKVLTPDLPGFGSEPEPSRPWSVDDYADWVERWMTKEVESGKCLPAGQAGKVENTKLHLLGHSHGGRIALKLAYRQENQPSTFPVRPHPGGHLPHTISHLFLCAPAGIRHPRHFKRILGLMLAKTGSFLLSLPLLKHLAPLGKKLLYQLVRVHDYEKASPVMRGTMIRVSREDLRPILKTIKIPTDLFWGKQDGMTPFSDGLLMERDIERSVLHAFDGVRHGVHRDRAREIARVIKERLYDAIDE